MLFVGHGAALHLHKGLADVICLSAVDDMYALQVKPIYMRP